MSEVESKVFICPFNAYHKQGDYRKMRFHMARCGDRRGKQVFHCQYHPEHLFISVPQLLEHEKECPNKKQSPLDLDGQETSADDENQIKQQMRLPAVVYCSFDVNHHFKDKEQRDEHEKVCDKRKEYLSKHSQAQSIYQRHKNELKKNAADRKIQMLELAGQHNGPKSGSLPMLNYKYRMNEPFVGGKQAEFSSSREQWDHKKVFIYEIGDEAKKEKPISQAKQELINEIVKPLQEKSPEDMQTFLIKQETEEMFGLKVNDRDEKTIGLYDFDIEEYISFTQVQKLANLSKNNPEEIKEFVDQNTVLKMTIFEQENQKGWRSLAQRLVDQFQMAQLGGDPMQRRTICLNSTRGNQVNCGFQFDSSTHNTFLFLVNKSTEIIGGLLEDGVDYALLKLQVPFTADEKAQIQAQIMNKGVSVQSQRTPHEQQEMIRELQQEKQDLDARLKEAQAEIGDLLRQHDVHEKLIKDKERQTRQDKKQIEYLENDKKLIRGETKKIEEMLSTKETELKNLEKEMEHRTFEIKSIQLRFDKEKTKSENYQKQFNETSLQLKKVQELLTSANKAIKHKEVLLQDQQAHTEKLQKIVDQFKDISNLPKNVNQQASVPLQFNPKITAQKQQDLTKAEQAFGQPDVKNQNLKPEQANKRSNPEQTVTEIDEDEEDDGEGEILDDEVNTSQIYFNKLQADAVKMQQQQQQLASPNVSKGKVKSCNTMANRSKSKTKAELNVTNATPGVNENDLPEELLCAICLTNRKEVMIVACKHMVFCGKCETDYRLKYENDCECPICRKKYKKTLKVTYS